MTLTQSAFTIWYGLFLPLGQSFIGHDQGSSIGSGTIIVHGSSGLQCLHSNFAVIV